MNERIKIVHLEHEAENYDAFYGPPEGVLAALLRLARAANAVANLDPIDFDFYQFREALKAFDFEDAE